MNSRRKYPIIISLIIIQFMLINFCSSSSIESCLSAYGVNLTQNFGPNATLPIECQCSESDLICTNSAINNPQASDSTFPTLSILFLNDNSTLYYLLPKQRLTFWGYKSLLPNAFKGFKFVSTNGVSQFNDQIIYMYFAESYRFPAGTFSPFGNLDPINRNFWPKLSIEIFDNDLNNIISFEKGSFATMAIDSFSVKYAGPAANILSNAFDGSSINRLEIKNSPRFIGFTPLDPNSTITVTNLIIDTCPSFGLNDYTLPNFAQLNYLTIKSSGLQVIPSSVWAKFRSLIGLSLIGNLISYVDANAFSGIESQLLLLDLSYNPITNFDWNVFQKFTNLITLDLSYTAISTINSFIRIWPDPIGLKTVVLKGYNNTFDNRTICAFNSDVQNKKINLSTTFVQFESTYQCDCFLFYMYKDYRRNPANSLNDWLLANRTPFCYQQLYTQTGNFTLIQQNEDACNFPQILDLFCPKSTYTSTTYTTTTPCFSTQFSQPGQTTIIIGNQTSFSTTTAYTTPCITSTSYTSNHTSTSATQVTITSTTSPSVTSVLNSGTTTTIKQTTVSMSSKMSTTTTTSSLITTNSIATTTVATSTLSLTETDKAGTTSSPNQVESSTALPSLNDSNNGGFNTTSIIVISVLSVISLLLLFIILGLIIYFRNRLRSVSNSSGSQVMSPTTQTTIRIDEKGNKHIYRV